MGSAPSRSAIEHLWNIISKGENISLVEAALYNINDFHSLLEWRHSKVGSTVLMEAAASGNESNVKLLLDAGASIHTRDKSSLAYTALHYAILNDHVDIVRLLLIYGADIFQQTTRGHSALDIARFNNSIKCNQYISSRLTVYKGWIYFEDKSRFRKKTIWSRRYCLLLRAGGLVNQLEIAIMKSESALQPQKVLLIDPERHIASPILEPHWKDERKLFTFTFNSSLEIFRYDYLGFTRNSWFPRVNLRPKPRISLAKLSPEGGRIVMAAWLSFLSGNGRLGRENVNISRQSLPERIERSLESCLNNTDRDIDSSSILEQEQNSSDDKLQSQQEINMNISLNNENQYNQIHQERFSEQLDYKNSNQIKNFDREDRSCVICMDSIRDSVAIPCGHFAWCFKCANQIVNGDKSCSICRGRILNVMRIYQV